MHSTASLLQALMRETPSLESKGKTELEREYVIYGQIVDFEELKNAKSFEEQEQWELRSARTPELQYFGGVRVRKSWSSDKRGQRTYMLTIKTMQEGSGDKQETELLATADLFEQFKRLASNGMVKTRYFFPVTHEGQKLVWEVDVYKDAEGNPLKWCKIDLEVTKELQELPPLPIQLTDVIDTAPNERSPEQAAQVDKLMREHFLSPNLYRTAEVA